MSRADLQMFRAVEASSLDSIDSDAWMEVSVALDVNQERQPEEKAEIVDLGWELYSKWMG